MTASKTVVTSQIPTLDVDVPPFQNPVRQFDLLAAAVLHWRCDRLWVKSAPTQPVNPLPALYNDKWLKQCLIHSPIQAVCLDPVLGEATLKHWANACKQVKRTVFLRWPSVELPQRRSPLSWMLKSGLDWFVAACLLVLLSPFFFVLVGCVQYCSGQIVFSKEWRVGYRGKLFRTIKFCTSTKDGSRLASLESWMQTYHLDRLPQLLNVLRGDMSLVGPRLWTLSDPMRAAHSNARKRLNALPGIIGAWQTEGQTFCLDLEAANQSDLQYLNTWSLAQDFKILLTVFKGFDRLWH